MENLFKLSMKGVEKQPLDKLLSGDLGPPILNNSNYFSRVCANCALKIWNTFDLVLFLNMNLNPVIADVEETSDGCKTQQHWKRMSKSPSSAEKPVCQDPYCRTRE